MRRLFVPTGKRKVLHRRIILLGITSPYYLLAIDSVVVRFLTGQDLSPLRDACQKNSGRLQLTPDGVNLPGFYQLCGQPESADGSHDGSISQGDMQWIAVAEIQVLDLEFPCFLRSRLM